MYAFFVANALYLVLCIALIVWLGIAWYLTRLDKKVEHLEQRFSTFSNDQQP